MQLEGQDTARLGVLIRRFHREIVQQRTHDTEILNGLLRALQRHSNKTEADELRQLIREEVSECS